MDSAPDDDPLRRFLSGKRRSERRACNLPVEVHGGGAAFEGRAVDVSEGGAMIRLDDRALAHLHPDMGMIEALGVVDRYFQNGAQLVFTAEALRVPTSVVRLTPPKEGGGVHLGCRFERGLTEDETHRLLGTRPSPPPGPLALAPVAGPDCFLMLFPTGSLAAGPRYLARVTGLSGAELDARIEPVRPTPAEDVREDLRSGGVIGRLVRADEVLWRGDLKLVSARPGVARTPVVDVRVMASAAFPRAVTRRFAARRT